MRLPSPQDRFKLVKEGKLTQNEFVRQMRQQFPQYITNLNLYEDTVRILKNKSILFEEQEPSGPTKVSKLTPKYDERPIINYSLDSLDRGIRYELQLAGFGQTLDGVTKIDADKAKEKAQKNLDKDPNHYINLIAKGPSKDEDCSPKLVKRGAPDVDTKGGYYRVKLREDFRKIVSGIEKKYPNVDDKDILKFLKSTKINTSDVEGVISKFGQYVDSEFDSLEEKKTKSKPDFLDLDKDGDKKESMKKASSDKKHKDYEFQIKESVKDIIVSILSESNINEAATVNLANTSQRYSSFRDEIIELQDIVTDIERFSTKINTRINKVFDKMQDNQDTETALDNAATFVEKAFLSDVSPILKEFITDIKSKRAKEIQPIQDIEPIQEYEIEEKQTVFSKPKRR